MAEYWKSTPSYWCKFCSQYVRDTSIERKNHEASAKHQNNIQRSLRELHKGQERERRDKQAAKDEVARLNGMFSGGKSAEAKAATKQPSAPGPRVSQPAAPAVSTAAQRKAHAEQLAAMGVELPEELKKEITGVGSYQVVAAREVEPGANGAVAVNRSLADILAEARNEGTDSKEEIKTEEDDALESKGAHKRRADDDDDYRDEEAAPKMRKAWGSDFKRYPGTVKTDEDTGDLDALLSGVAKKKEVPVKQEKIESDEVVKKEEGEETTKPLEAVPDVNTTEPASDKQEDASAAPAVVFKKRKGKK